MVETASDKIRVPTPKKSSRKGSLRKLRVVDTYMYVCVCMYVCVYIRINVYIS